MELDRFYAPTSIDRWHIFFSLSFCPFSHLFVRKNFYISHIFLLVTVRAFIFDTIILPCDKTFLLVTSSMSYVKVKYQGVQFSGAFVFHKHILFTTVISGIVPATKTNENQNLKKMQITS